MYRDMQKTLHIITPKFFTYFRQTEHPPMDTVIAKVLLDNVKLLDNTALMKDCELTKQIMYVQCVSGKQTGVILVPEQYTCSGCGTALLLRSDRPSHLALYTETMGTLPCLHYHKYCPNRK